MPLLKRIAIFSITYDPFIGGAEVGIKEVAKRLDNDFEFDLFTARLDVRLPKQQKIGNVNVHRLGAGRPFLDKLFYPWRAQQLALKMHARNPYALVHAIMANYAGFAALLFKKRVPSVPYLLTLQSGDSDWFIRLRTWFWHPWYCQIYTQADKITAISNWLKGRALRYGYKGDIEIIPNGVDVEKFDIQISDEERSSTRKSWGANENDFVVITTSRLVHKNGVDILIDAMEYLDSNVKLVIAGGGKDEEKLKRQAKKFGNRVVFLGNIDHKNIPALLKSSDLFARPSRSEGMGNSFVEAKIAGLPVLGVLTGGIIDLKKDDVLTDDSALSLANNNPKAVAEIISRLSRDLRGESRSLLQTVLNKSKSSILQKYNWGTIAMQYKAEYQKLIK